MFNAERRNSYALTLATVAMLLVAGCRGKDKDARESLDPDRFFLDYKISAAEGNDNLTVMLQLLDGDDNAISIPGAGSIMLDGETIIGDSTKLSGVFYELHKPIALFEGEHTIVFTGADKKEYQSAFYFESLVMLTTLPDTISRDSLVVEFSGIGPNDQLRVVLTDTAFENDDDVITDRLISGNATSTEPPKRQLVLTPDDLLKLASGPVQFEFIRELEKEIKGPGRDGGRLIISYTLKREFFLLD